MTDDTLERFSSGGQGIACWLWELVCDDLDRRTTASKALNAMRDNLPKRLHGRPYEFAKWWDEYGREIRKTLAQPDFNAAAYIRRLATFMRDAQSDRMKHWHEEQKRSDRVIGKLVSELNEQDLPQRRQDTVHKRLGRVICSGCDTKRGRARISSALLSQQVTAMLVFQELGDHVLLVPEVLREQMRVPHEQHLAFELMRKLGPRASIFVEDLMAMLKNNPPWELPRTLAAVIRDDPARIAIAVDLLDSNDAKVAGAAAGTLYWLGERAREHVPDCIDRLMLLTNSQSPIRTSAMAALGKVTHGLTVAVDKLLRLTSDPDMWVRGTAISALGNVGTDPQKVVPRLIECFADYEEQDPDLTYGSRHTRVTDALAEFGPAAAPAVPALIQHLRNEEGTDRGVLKALGTIGPSARDALPELERVAAEEEIDLASDLDLAIAVRKIRGESD